MVQELQRVLVDLDDKYRDRIVDYYLAIWVEKDGDCLLWTGTTNNEGYGVVTVLGTRVLLHRLVAFSKLLKTREARLTSMGMFVCHICDRRRCVNQEHLFFGTNKDNMADAVSKGRIAHGEMHYMSKLTQAQVDEIRTRYREERITTRELGREYGVSHASISLIVRGKRWSQSYA